MFVLNIFLNIWFENFYNDVSHIVHNFLIDNCYYSATNSKLIFFEIYEYILQNIMIYILFAYVFDTRSYLNAMLMAEFFYSIILILYILNCRTTLNSVPEIWAITMLILTACESTTGLTFLITLKKKMPISIYIDTNNTLRG